MNAKKNLNAKSIFENYKKKRKTIIFNKMTQNE